MTISTVFETVPTVETFDASLDELDDRLTEKKMLQGLGSISLSLACRTNAVADLA